ncbi:cytochrome c oxidase assembly protein [Novosphingobium sp. BW1]|uniref:cytochrome c oxidase assembly protein n=1 Tax=Novosphingobium sp. BW1 TaxID=2592621 RepID=UPI0011DECAEC|nr:cytochrome c oxidase assembly protein [Novosphingobium sp. BW1]TYC90427.1 cytochrome c oxidase assembly protein [Novosphingobium sp. BW1]
MKRAPLGLGLALVPLGVLASRWGMTGHMAGHMLAVAIAAPLLAWGLTGSGIDPARRHSGIVAPLPMMLLELMTVWGWHLPLLRALADSSLVVAVLEQASFLAAGTLLWCAALNVQARAAGIGALLLTSMHMTLLGVLIGLAPRPLYICGSGPFGLDALSDQQLGGVVMLLVGGASYLIGGLALLLTLLRAGPKETA